MTWYLRFFTTTPRPVIVESFSLQFGQKPDRLVEQGDNILAGPIPPDRITRWSRYIAGDLTNIQEDPAWLQPS